jgi:hypothetical protein
MRPNEVMGKRTRRTAELQLLIDCDRDLADIGDSVAQ